MNQYDRNKSKAYHAKQLAREREGLAAMKRDDGYAPPPFSIALALNNQCFLRCLHCDVGEARRYKKKNFFYIRATGDEKKKHEIPLDVLKRLVDEVAVFEPVIRPTFLEPLLRKDIFELAEYVKDRGLIFNLQTNGVLLPKKYQDIISSGIDVVRVSLDGPEAIHDDIRGLKGGFSKVIEGLKLIIQQKQKMRLEKPVLGISYVITSMNYRQINAFMEELEKRGLLQHVYIAFCFLRFVTSEEARIFNATKPEFMMTSSSLTGTGRDEIDPELLIGEIRQLFNRFPTNEHHYYFNPTPLTENDLRQWYGSDVFLYPEVTCHVPWSHCQILYNGDVVVNGRCCSPSFGNIYSHSFMDIWNSERARKFRMELLRRGNFTVCNRCSRKFNATMLKC